MADFAMKKLILCLTKVAAHLFCLFGLLTVHWLSANRYEWMVDIDPAHPELPTNAGNNSGAAVFVVMLVVLVVELLLFRMTQNRKEKMFSIVVGLGTAIYAVAKFSMFS